jgi:hypothetical protein
VNNPGCAGAHPDRKALANPSSGQPAGTLPGSVGKGPVGWDSYRQLDQLPALRSGTETRDFDSTDPAQTNADFDHPLRVTADGQYVIAEAYGPGARLGMELEPKISTNGVGISQEAFLTPCR